ncbi:MAG: hypothetical protein HKN30_17110 [Sulfitobacter sp.]|nr:hypothetical protein [Sulfitobacter sp.]
MKIAGAATGIVFFTRTGHTKRVAKRLAQALSADLIPMRAPQYEKGFRGYMRAAIDSLRHINEHTPQDFESLTDYDRIVLCAPVWTSFPAVPLRGLLHGNVALPSSVSLFLTSGAHSPTHKAFRVAETDLGRSFVAKASLPNDWEGTPKEERIFARFFRDLDPAQGIAAAL